MEAHPSRRIALVTGASSGIGRELARQLAARGYDLWLVARREERLEELARIIRSRAGREAEVLRLDLTSLEDRRRLIELMSGSNREIALVVNNAGFGAVGPTVNVPCARYQEMIELNIAALTELSWVAARIFRARGSGGIINVASTAAFQSVPYMNVYSATKAYVLSFTEALAVELKGEGVRVMALCPGYTRTEFQRVAGVRRDAGVLRREMSPELCVRIGLNDFERGRTISVTGAFNRLQVFAARLAPRKLVLAAAAKMMKGREIGD